MRAACALNQAAGCAPSASGRKSAAAAPTCSHQRFNAPRRRRPAADAAAKATSSSSSSQTTDLVTRPPFDIDPLPSKDGLMPSTYPAAVLSAQEVCVERDFGARELSWQREDVGDGG